MSTADAEQGRVVVNRAVSVDGFVAGPGHDMTWIFEHLRDDLFPEVVTETGAMLVGRTTYEVARRMAPEDTSYDGGHQYVLTHRLPAEPDPSVTFLTGDLVDAVEVARAAAGGKNLEVLGADLASQCLGAGLVDEVLVYVLPVLLGDGVRFSTPDQGRVDLEPLGATSAGDVTMLRFRVRRPSRGGARSR